MTSVFDHVERLRGKPHHTKKQIALMSALGITGLVALVWLTASVATGAFAIKGSSFADLGTVVPVTTAGTTNNTDQLGAAAAAPSASSSRAPGIEIVDTTPAAAAAPGTDASVIPF